MIGNFVSPIYKQLNINQLALPLEICDLIQSYLFYNKESITFIKKLSSNKLELTLIKKAWTRTNSSGFSPSGMPIDRLTPDSSNWIWGFTHENDPYQKEYLQGKKLNSQKRALCLVVLIIITRLLHQFLQAG